MARIGEFCTANVARLLLSVTIVVALLLCIAVWFYHQPGHGTSIESPSPSHSPAEAPHQ